MFFQIAVLISIILMPVYGGDLEKIRTETDNAQVKALRKSCQLLVHFGSYGSGIDHKTAKKIKKNIQVDERIKEGIKWTYGLEGDTSFCLRVPDQGQRLKVYEKIKALIPKETKEGATSIEMGDQKFKSRWPVNPVQN